MPLGFPAFVKALYSFPFPGCSPVGIPGLHATPVLYGRTEPPGRLPSCARLPPRVTPGAGRISPVLPGFHRQAFILSAPGLVWASLHSFTRLQLRGRLSKSCNPCPLRPDSAPWPPFLPAPGSHGIESHPRAALGFPRFYPVSTDRPFSSRLPDSPGPL